MKGSQSAANAGTALYEHLHSFVERHGVAVSRRDTRPANGYYDRERQRIAVGTHLSTDHAAKTLAHETAHFVADHHALLAGRDAETIAESSAFVVLSHYGLDTASYSFPYVAGWAKDKAVLKRNLDAIQKTANRIIEGIEGAAEAGDDSL